MSYTDPNGSIVLPSGTIVPYANLSLYGNSTAPSGFLFADGYYWDITKYPTLFAAIGYTYGKVNVATTDPVSFDSKGNVITNPCFRTPNLMNQNYSYSYYNTITQQTVSFPAQNYNPGIQYTTVGGNVTTATVNSTNQVTLSVNQMPSHTHGVSDPRHNHQISQTLIGPGGDDGVQYFSTAFASGGSASATSTTGISIQNTGGNEAITVPVPSFVMPYLIKL